MVKPINGATIQQQRFFDSVWHRAKTSKKANPIDPCSPHVRKRVEKVNIWPPFCIDFSTFS
jgi:hypothetical protein